MRKTEIVQRIAETTKMTQKDVNKVISSLFEVIGETLKSGEKVQFTGFGTFETRQRAARNGKNPRTGGTVKITACRVPAFKAGKQLKDKVN